MEFEYATLLTVQIDCAYYLIRSKHHLHQKTPVLPYEPKKLKLFGLSVEPAMFFSRRWMFAPLTNYDNSLSELLPTLYRTNSLKWGTHPESDRYPVIQFGQAVLELRARQQSILLHEKSIVSPTERSGNAQAFHKLAGQDLRFLMKMMFAAGSYSSLQPV